MANDTVMLNLSENHDTELISCAVIFSLISLITVVGRFISKRLKRNSITLDDHLLIGAWIIATAGCSNLAAATQYAGFGWHKQALNNKQLIALQKVLYTSYALDPTTLALSKLSLLILLQKIFASSPRFRLAARVLGIIVICWWIAMFFGELFICEPVDSRWVPTRNLTCGNQFLLDLIARLPWVLTDFAILVAPIPVIRKLQVVRKKKVGLYGVFLFGGITCVVTVLRYAFVSFPVADLSYELGPIGVMTIVEAQITVACSALVGCGPVINYLMPERLLCRLKWKSIKGHTGGRRVHSSNDRIRILDGESEETLRGNRAEFALQDCRVVESRYATEEGEELDN